MRIDDYKTEVVQVKRNIAIGTVLILFFGILITGVLFLNNPTLFHFDDANNSTPPPTNTICEISHMFRRNRTHVFCGRERYFAGSGSIR